MGYKYVPFECLFCGYDITIQEEPLNLSFGFQTKRIGL